MTLAHDIVRDKLIAITQGLMADGGLETVKARALAQKAGVSVGTLYNLFGNVDGLIRAASSEVFKRLYAVGIAGAKANEAKLASLIDTGQLGASEAEKLRFRLLGLSETYMGFIDAEGGLWGAVLAFNRSRPAATEAEWYLDQQDGLLDMVGGLIEASPIGGDVETRKIAGRALWSAIHGIVTLNYVGQVRADARNSTRQQIDLLVTTFVRGLFVAPSGRVEADKSGA